MADLGQVTRAFVSPYSRFTIHDSRLYPREKRLLVADFNGAIPVGVTLASVVWSLQPVCCVAMADAAINERETQVMLTAVFAGSVAIRCEATLSNGEVYNQIFRIAVLCGPFWGDNIDNAGPAQLTATA